MKSTPFFSTLKTGALALCCAALLTACSEEDNDFSESAPTMGDPKNSSPNASRCYTISQFIEDGQNETDDYANIRFEFFNSGNVIARSPNQEWQGSWNIGFDDGVQKLFLNFMGTAPFLNELTDDWAVVSLNQNTPKFVEDGGNNPDILWFQRSDCEPTTGPPSPGLQDFNDNLLGGSWTISSFIDQGVNEANDYNNVTFTFNEDGTVVAQRFNQQRIGQWTTDEDNAGFELRFQFNGPPGLNELNEEWDVVNSSATELQLEDVGPGDNDFLTFSRN